MLTKTRIALIGLLGLTATGLTLPLHAQPAKEPPSCAAIRFRPVPSGMNDGEQDAGLYKSRFGRIELKATVKTGEPQDYFVELDGKQVTAAATPPASLAPCAQSKKLPAPTAASGACTGDGFMVVVVHSGKERVIGLYGRQGKAWHFCRAGTA
ncbi:MAG TPA: hypothetical protein VMC10_05235 [Stellaceae bacterium]|nr:hypothetical protein [Stellaceae bacterium]